MSGRKRLNRLYAACLLACACGGTPFEAGSEAGGSAGAPRGGGGGASGGETGGAIAASGNDSLLSGCDWQRAGCSSCDALCTNEGGTFCQYACETIIDCVQQHPGCGTAEDPMCVRRANPSGDKNVCTDVWESAGKDDRPPTNAASRLFGCACAPK